MSTQQRLIIIAVLFVLGMVWVSAQGNPPAILVNTVDVTSNEGWSCGDFPCEDDVDGFLERIQVPDGFTLSLMGKFSGQPVQIAFNQSGQLFATVLEKGTQRGAVYRLNDDGTTQRVSPRFWSPVGLAFDADDQLYVSSRLNADSVGVVWQVGSVDYASVVVANLPCCYSVSNQPNGMMFGDDGLLYLGVGSLSDRGESMTPESERFATIQPYEASVLQINVDTSEIQSYAGGIRNPFDVVFTSDGQLYATDNGLVTGEGDRILQVNAGEFYGFPYWRSRGCSDCPSIEGSSIAEDWIRLPNYTLPRGITVYDGAQFPANFVDTLFVAFWNGTDYAQRIVWIDPENVYAEHVPQAFVTGLIRPIDVAIAPDGSLVIADFVYGHIWRVSYGEDGASIPLPEPTSPPQATVPPTPTPRAGGLVFATATPST
jgi:glucose/arabinose dehydrogenase